MASLFDLGSNLSVSGFFASVVRDFVSDLFFGRVFPLAVDALARVVVFGLTFVASPFFVFGVGFGLDLVASTGLAFLTDLMLLLVTLLPPPGPPAAPHETCWSRPTCWTASLSVPR